MQKEERKKQTSTCYCHILRYGTMDAMYRARKDHLLHLLLAVGVYSYTLYCRESSENVEEPVITHPLH